MRHTTTRSRVARPVRALLAAVLVMAIGVAPAGVAEPTADQSAPDSVSAEQPALDAGLPSVDSGAAEAADGDSGTDAAAPASPSGAATSPAQSSPAATPRGTAPLGPSPLFPGAVTEDGITVKRDGDVDTIHVHDSEGELWQWGGKASEENIFALTRKGEVTEVLSVTADGRELDRKKFGWVNTKDGTFIGFDLNALQTIPPVDVTIKVKTKTTGDYSIAESEDIPTKIEFIGLDGQPEEEDLTALGYRVSAGSGQAWSLERKMETSDLTGGTVNIPSTPGLGISGNGKPFLSTTVTGSHPNQIGKDIRVTRVRVWNEENNSNRVNLPMVLRKNGTRYYPSSNIETLPIKDDRGRIKGYDIQFFDPVDGKPGENVDIWSGNDIAMVFNSSTGRVTPSNYKMEVYGSYRVDERLRNTYSWEEKVGDTVMRSTVYPADSEGVSRVEVSRTTTEEGEISGHIWGSVKEQNGYFLSNEAGEPTVRITAPNGKVLYERTAPAVFNGDPFPNVAQNDPENRGWGGVDFYLPERIAAPVGSKIELIMNFKPNPDVGPYNVVDKYVAGPTGPVIMSVGFAPEDLVQDAFDDKCQVFGDGGSGKHKYYQGVISENTAGGPGQRVIRVTGVPQELATEKITLTVPEGSRITKDRVEIFYTSQLDGGLTTSSSQGATRRNMNAYSEVSADGRTLTVRPPGGGNDTIAKGGAFDVSVSTVYAGLDIDARVQLVGAARDIKIGKVTDSPTDEVQMATPAPKRTLTDEERLQGTQVYVSTSVDANGGTGNRTLMVKTNLSQQIQGSDTFQKIGDSEWIYNGLAYDPADNWLYAISQYRKAPDGKSDCYPPGNLLQINPVTGAVRNLGPVLDANGVPLFDYSYKKGQQGLNDMMLINSGVVSNGTLYLANGALSGTQKLYKVPLPSSKNFGAPTPQGTKIDGSRTVSEDLAVHPDDPGHAWGIVGSNHYGKTGVDWKKFNANGGPIILERLDLQTGKAEYFPLTEAQRTTKGGEVLKAETTFGKAWTYANGNLGFAVGGQSSAGSPGAQIRITNPSSPDRVIQVEEVLWNVPFSYNTDASSNGLRAEGNPQSDLVVLKQRVFPDDQNFQKELAQAKEKIGSEFKQYTFWEVQIKNVGDGASSGGRVEDEIPEGYLRDSIGFLPGTLVNGNRPSEDWAKFTSKETLNTMTGYLELSSGALWPGESARFFIFAKQPDGACAPNAATVFNNDNDTNQTNNKVEAGCDGSSAVQLRLNKVDYGNRKVALDGARFELHEMVNGAPAPESIELSKAADGVGYSTEKVLKRDTEYMLIETQAPSREVDNQRVQYSLLTEPVIFKISKQDGKDVVAFRGQNGEFSTDSPVMSVWQGSDLPEKETDTVYLELANVRQGNLPKTGGPGLQAPLALSTVLMLVGAALARRRMTRA